MSGGVQRANTGTVIVGLGKCHGLVVMFAQSKEIHLFVKVEIRFFSAIFRSLRNSV